MNGIVRKVCPEMRIGWVRLPESGRDVYSFRARSVEGVAIDALRTGQPVTFELRWDAAGRRCWAVQVRPA